MLADDYNHTALLDAMCNTSDVVLIYALIDQTYTHIISAVAALRGIPVFLYDTDLFTQYNTVGTTSYCSLQMKPSCLNQT